MNDQPKLYRVKLNGPGYPYVVATDPTEALKKVQTYLDEKNLGFKMDREMSSIELLAEVGDYPDCGTQLFL